MRGRRTVRASLGLAGVTLAIGLISAACFPPPPPAPPAHLTISPSPAQFANSSQAQSFPMPTVTVTITNTGGHTARNISVPGISVYSVPQDFCSILAPGQSCGAIIQFCPSAQGQYNSILTVTGQDATSGAPLSASTMLMGTAVP
jgi:hypothetical protein